MTVFFGDFEDLSNIDFRQLEPKEYKLAEAQARVRKARKLDLQPELDDVKTVVRGAWHKIHTLGGPISGKGDRLYVLSFAAPFSYVKVGRTPHLRSRIVEHERVARTQFGFLLDAWVSPSLTDATPWESRVVALLDGEVDGQRVRKCVDLREYYYGLNFRLGV
ncbi:hypothetical protein GCM10020229_48280 [Kitasatospora albolonga]|uniref:hypothetical protein n=1 Tax=Kitasatospora albolonga TaxID=68173 RepID=UPI0031ED1158